MHHLRQFPHPDPLCPPHEEDPPEAGVGIRAAGGHRIRLGPGQALPPPVPDPLRRRRTGRGPAAGRRCRGGAAFQEQPRGLQQHRARHRVCGLRGPEGLQPPGLLRGQAGHRPRGQQAQPGAGEQPLRDVRPGAVGEQRHQPGGAGRLPGHQPDADPGGDRLRGERVHAGGLPGDPFLQRPGRGRGSSPIALYPDQPGNVFRENFLLEMPNSLAALVPEYAAYASVVRVVHLPDTRRDGISRSSRTPSSKRGSVFWKRRPGWLRVRDSLFVCPPS